MKIKLLVSLAGFLLMISSVSARTFVVPHILEVSSGITPNSVFYFLDNWGEWINLKITFNQAKRAEKKLQYASERLAELEALGDMGDIKKEHAEKIKNKYEELNADVENDIKDLKAKGQDVAELIKKIEAISVRQIAVLEEVLEKVPEQAKDAIEHALEVSKRGHERAIEAIEKEVEDGKIKLEDLGDDLRNEVKQKKGDKSLELKEIEIDEER